MITQAQASFGAVQGRRVIATAERATATGAVQDHLRTRPGARRYRWHAW